VNSEFSEEENDYNQKSDRKRLVSLPVFTIKRP